MKIKMMYRFGASLGIIGLVALGATRAHSSQAAPNAGQALSYHNPVFSRDFPDPMVLRVNAHSYYAYGTTADWSPGAFPILHSTDMVHWKRVSSIFKRDPKWTSGDLWAPDVVHVGKTYYAYYTGLGSDGHCIAVATASTPVGPFKQRDVVACSDLYGKGYIDPDLFIDTNGKAYLYFSVDGPQHNISVLAMKKSLLERTGQRHELFGLTQSWEHGKDFSTVEGPFTIRQGSTYYLFFSGNSWNSNYAMGYATSSSPMGPFTPYAGNPILQGNDKVHGPGGGSVVQGPDGRLYMVYHGWPGPEGYDHGGIRNMRIDLLVWNGPKVSITVTAP